MDKYSLLRLANEIKRLEEININHTINITHLEMTIISTKNAIEKRNTHIQHNQRTIDILKEYADAKKLTTP
jgi:hypothetical protein